MDRRRRPQTDEHRANIAEGLRGRRQTAEHRRNISRALTGRPKSPEHIARIVEAKRLRREERLAKQKEESK